MSTDHDKILRFLSEHAGEPLECKGVTYHVYNRATDAFICGFPYTWTQYAERAYAFGSRKDARRFINQFKREISTQGRVGIIKRDRR